MNRFLIDANLPKRLRFWRDSECTFLPDTTWHDSRVWRYAREHDLTIVTKDLDFERLALEQAPPQVIRLCVGSASRQAIWYVLSQWWEDAQARCQQPGCRLVRIYPDFIESI